MSGWSPDDPRAGQHLVEGIHVSVRGTGPPVLALHGIGGSADSFREQLAGLGDTHQVIAWDAPGYARSADPDPQPALRDYASSAAALLNRLGRAPAHVIGVSWGGVIATRLALDFPETVRGLVLAGSSRGSGRTARGAAAMSRRGAELAGTGAAAFAAARAPRLLAPDVPPGLVETVTANMATAIRLPGYAYAAASMAATDHSTAVADLRVPTLVVVGEHDAITGSTESEALAQAVPGARLVVIPGAGHAANQERPKLVNDHLRAFFAEVEKTPCTVPGVAPSRTSRRPD